jgi:hypothetical protein
MSLLSAMLLDPYRDPREVWIALLTDGQRGSGTVDDPYNATPSPLKRFSVSLSAPDPGKTWEAVASTGSVSHTFSDNEMVRISGVTGPDATYWNGDFIIYEANATTFKYRMQYHRTNGLPAAAEGNPSAATLSFPFDYVMKNLVEGNSIIHLGPGVFETRGFNYATAAIGWQAKSGQRILGSGIGATTLRLVQRPEDPGLAGVIVAGEFQHGFEVADLTIDCNMGGQPVPPGKAFAELACGAVAAGGSHVRLRRLRVINFGTQTSGAECFVLTASAAHPNDPEDVDCVIEDCIVEQPALNNLRETTCLQLGGGERPDDGVMAYHRACVIRNCFVNCEYATDPVAIDSIVIEAAQTAKATTRGPHGRKAYDWIVVSGAVEVENGKQSQSRHFNGSFKVTSTEGSDILRFQYHLDQGEATAPAGTMFLDRYSSHEVRVSLTNENLGSLYRVTVESFTPHNRKPGDSILLFGNTNGGNRFEVVEVLDPYRFTFETSDTPPSGGTISIGPFFQAISADAGTAAVVAGNRVLHCRTGGPYHDTYSTRDVLARENFYHDVFSGPVQLLGWDSLTKDARDAVFTGSTSPWHAELPSSSYKHAFRVGDRIDLYPPRPGNVPYQWVQVSGVSSATGFDFEQVRSPDPPQLPNLTGARFTGPYLPPDYGLGPGRPLASLALTTYNDCLAVSATLFSDGNAPYPDYYKHNLTPGDVILIARAGHFDQADYPHADRYSGFFRVLKVIDDLNFLYGYLAGDPRNPSANPPDPADDQDFAAGYMSRIWQAQRILVEDNWFELAYDPDPYGNRSLRAIGTINAPPILPEYRFRQVLIRDNLVRLIDDPSYYAYALPEAAAVLGGGENLVIEGNTIGLPEPAPPPNQLQRIQFSDSKWVRCAGNRTPEGEPVLGYEYRYPFAPHAQFLPDADNDAVETAFLAAFL